MEYICRKCGGELIPRTDGQSGQCEYCGSIQPLPKVDSKLYNEAVRLRQEQKFERAAVLFHECIEQNPTDAEAYWNIVLCKFAIEYVDEGDKKIPINHGISYSSIMDDPDYRFALKYADPESRKAYEEEAAVIQKMQQAIIERSAGGEKFDVFISYKETGEDGRRTVDSVIAQDIYTQLTDMGYKVFLSRVTLRDKAGPEFEPVIYGALLTARLMILVGTREQHMSSLWVAKEWKRYLELMEKEPDSRSMLVVTRGMRKKDFPDELLFMSNIMEADEKNYFLQDLGMGVRRLLGEPRFASRGAAFDSSREVEDLLLNAQKHRSSNKETALFEVNRALILDPKSKAALLTKFLILSNDRTKTYPGYPVPQGEVSTVWSQYEALPGIDENEVRKTEEWYRMIREAYGAKMLEEAREASKFCNTKERIDQFKKHADNTRKYVSSEDKRALEALEEEYRKKCELHDRYIEETSPENIRKTFAQRFQDFGAMIEKEAAMNEKCLHSGHYPGLVFTDGLKYLTSIPLFLVFRSLAGSGGYAYRLMLPLIVLMVLLDALLAVKTQNSDMTGRVGIGFACAVFPLFYFIFTYIVGQWIFGFLLKRLPVGIFLSHPNLMLQLLLALTLAEFVIGFYSYAVFKKKMKNIAQHKKYLTETFLPALDRVNEEYYNEYKELLGEINIKKDLRGELKRALGFVKGENVK